MPQNTSICSSNNSNNTGPTDSEFVTEFGNSHCLRYWVPTASKLSRGKKGIIQRMFTGEPKNNLCNVYIYNETSKLWYHEHTIQGNSSEDFGRSLDGTDNADIVAVGAPGTWFGSVSNISGYARVFTKNSSGNGWTQRGSDVSQQGGFGHSVALSQYDGNILVVGAPFFNTLVPNNSGDIHFKSVPVSEGKVYIYKWNSTNYTLQQTLNSPSGTLSTTATPATWKNFYFGYSLGITDIGDKIIVGEPSIRNIWYEPDQTQGGGDINAQWATNSFPYTGNAHVYHNFTVLSGGSSWTSNVSMTSVIGTTGIGTTYDTNPLKVRWLDALGTSVDINRAGTRILAGGPGSYGTSNTAPHAMSGRIYTLDWDPVDSEWKEMGEISKHIAAPQGNMLLGKTTRFDGSGRRIVSGATGYVDHITYNKGNVLIFDFNGDQWVSFPNEMVELAGSFFYWTNYQHKLGESISIDGEGEMVAIGKTENHWDLYNTSASPAAQVSGGFTVDNITYIGGATTSVAGSDSQISTGASTIWVYNISQSMIIKGNVSIGGYIQGTGISIGTNDDSSTSSKSIYFGGSKSDNAYELTVIENRVYETDEKAELLIFKGNDNADASGGGTYGPDRIRLKGGQIAFDLNAGYNRTAEDIRAVMHRNAGGAGMLGINVTSPTEVIDVDGKIKATQGFIGNGTEITGLDLNHITGFTSSATGVAGSTTNDMEMGEVTISSSALWPNGAMTSNTAGVSGYTLSASYNASDVWRAFNDNTTNDSTNRWEFGTYNVYLNGGSNRGDYLGSVERIAGYKGEWFEVQMPSQIFIQKLEIYANSSLFLPRLLYVLGSNNGIEYYLIHTASHNRYWGTSSVYNQVFDRSSSINTNTDTSYSRLLFVINSISGGNAMYYQDIKITGITATYTQKIKLDKTGKIGILNNSPSYPLDVTGNANITGGLRANGSAGSSGQVLTSSGGGAMSWTTKSSSAWTTSFNDVYRSSGRVGIGTSSPSYDLDVDGNMRLMSGLRVGNSASTGSNGQVLTSSGGGAMSWTTVSGAGGNSSLSGTNTFEWGTGVSGKETNAGKIGYSTWSGGGNNALDIIGAGTSSSNRAVRIWDKLGIGTSSPSGPLHIYESTGSSRSATSGTLVLDHGDSGGSSCIVFPSRRNNNSDYGYIQYEDSTSSGDEKSRLIIGTENDGSGSNEDNVILAPSGKVGIGTNTPSYLLDVNGTMRLASGLYVNNSYGSSGQVLTSGGGGTMSWTTVSGGFSGDIADYITHTGDANTYFGFPSDDTFIIKTNGTERLRANSSGNIGIGTTSPSHELDVSGDINLTGSLRINGTAQTFGGGSSAWTTSSSDVYRSSGNVGIGTTSPSYPLHVIGNANITGGLRANGSAGSNGQVLTSSGGGAMTWTTVSGGGGSSAWTTSGSDVYRSSGKVGIGTSSPGAPLHIECADTSTHYENGLLVKQDSSSYPAVIGIRTSSTSQDPFISFMIDSDSTGWSYGVDASDTNKMKWAYYTSDLSTSTKLTLTNDGKLGIGTSTPGAPLEIKASGSSNPWENGLYVYNNSTSSGQDAIVTIRSGSSSAGDPFLALDVGGENGWSFGIDNDGYNKLKWSTSWDSVSSNTKMTLTRDGKLGIGTTGPGYPLDVVGDINLSGSLRINGTAQTFGGGGGSSGYGTADFNSYISTSSYDVEIESSFTSSNYNYNSDKKYFSGSGFDYIDIRSSLPSSLWYEYHFRFDGYSNTIYDSFYVKINGSSKTTYVSLPNYSSSFSCSSSRVYEWVLKPIGSSANDWTAQLIEYRS